jgi:hypothetical protein
MTHGQILDGHTPSAYNINDRLRPSTTIEHCTPLAVERQVVCGDGHHFPTGPGDLYRIAGSGLQQGVREQCSAIAVYLEYPRERIRQGIEAVHEGIELCSGQHLAWGEGW